MTPGAPTFRISAGDAMELIDRAAQARLLGALGEAYPRESVVEFGFAGLDHNVLAVNLRYLEEHGLIKVTWMGDVELGAPPQAAIVTAKGVDFLQDDGGLTAVLGVVTVRLEAETLRALLQRKIIEVEGDALVKQRLMDQLRSLPGEALKNVVLRVVDAGINNAPRALEILQGAIMGAG